MIRREEMTAWFVWTKAGRPPKFAHHTREGAEAEAQRLAALHPDRKFIVLEAVAKFSAVSKRVADCNLSVRTTALVRQAWGEHATLKQVEAAGVEAWRAAGFTEASVVEMQAALKEAA